MLGKRRLLVLGYNFKIFIVEKIEVGEAAS